MQATELYEIGCRAYNGDRDARRLWLAKVARLAMPIAAKYGVLPGLFAAKAALESGYASDQYEVDFYELQYGVEMGRKAQKHNNIVGMNAFPDNCRYLDSMPEPLWIAYKKIFHDYGPHFKGDEIRLVKGEPWKHYESVEDCCEDWCANIRWQAERHNRLWGTAIKEQLLAIESYTPEGERAETSGLNYAWQDYILYLYNDYDLYAYDREVYGMTVKMTQANLDAHIKKAYEYAHLHCHYAPCVTYPPMENGCADCSALSLRALYTMGYLTRDAFNIDDIHRLCEAAGLKKSTDINDAWRRHGIVCFQDKNNVGTQHINHVFYSLGGTSVNRIGKYDLGSDTRIQSVQPFQNVPVNEWLDRRNFLCVYHIPDDEPKKQADTPPFAVESLSYGKATKSAGVYAGPGTAWRKIGSVKPGDEVLSGGVVTNAQGHLWRAVRLVSSGTLGYVGSSAVRIVKFATYAGIVRGTDGHLSLRVGAGAGCFKIGDIPEGDTVRVDGEARAEDGTPWLHVKWRLERGFVSAEFVVKI